ncbi:MAG: transposase, partial [Terriglobia bacterium]
VAQTFLSAHNGNPSLSHIAELPVSELSPELRITRRRLPHWALEGAAYFVTFRLFREPLTLEEIRLVRDHIVSGDPRYYELLAVTVLADHVHLLLRPEVGRSLGRVMKGIKGVTARELNRRRGRKGSIWQDESFDRIVRDEAELLEKLNYMFLNPVKAGLTNDPRNYPGWYLGGERAQGGQTGMSAPPTDKTQG